MSFFARRISYCRGTWLLMQKYRARGEWNAVWSEFYYMLRFILTGKDSWE